MSKPGSPMAHQARTVTLDSLLKAQYGIEFSSPKPQIVGSRKGSQCARKISIGLAALVLLIAAMRIYVASIAGPISLTLMVCSGVVDVGLYLLGFLSAYLYRAKTLEVPLDVIEWGELIPGIINFGVAWGLIHWKELRYTGLIAVILFWAFGFLTSPPIRDKVGPILNAIGKLIKILPFNVADKSS